MGYSRALSFAISALLAAFVQGRVTTNDLSGVWRGYSRPTATVVFTSAGSAIVCVESLPPEYAKQLPPIEETYTINGTTLSQEARDRIGIATKELSAGLTPACAKHEIFPLEATGTVPPSRIVSYDSEAERVLYIDPRRPKEINCMPIRYRTGDQGPYLEVEHIITYQGNAEDAATLGSTFIRDSLPEVCSIEVEGVDLNAAVSTAFNLICIEGYMFRF